MITGVENVPYRQLIESIQWGGAIIGILSGCIVIYRYFLKRPALALEMECVGDIDHADQVPMIFTVANDGQRYAEDVLIDLELSNMYFIEFTEQGLETADQIFGNLIDYREFNAPHAVDSIVSHDEEIAVEEPKTVQKKRTIIYIDDILYSNTGVQVTARIGAIESDHVKIEYRVACRSHEPRPGIIDIWYDGEDVTVKSKEPAYRAQKIWKIWNRIKRSLPE